MSEAQAEHRGWEPSSEYNPHPFDDADWNFDAEAPGSTGFWVVMVLLLVIGTGNYLLGKWLEPPHITFAAPSSFEPETRPELTVAIWQKVAEDFRQCASLSVQAEDESLNHFIHRSLTPLSNGTCLLFRRRKQPIPTYGITFPPGARNIRAMGGSFDGRLPQEP